MIINNVYAIYFSPTKGTEKCVKTIASELKENYIEINITNFDNRHKIYTFDENDIVIIGVPVYGGRIPQLYDGLLNNIKGNNTKAVFIVSYGNRDYDDALLELKNVMESKGFIGIGAGAFIAQHTYTDKLGTNRPDDKDKVILREFADKIKEKVHSQNMFEQLNNIKGNPEYKNFVQQKFAPTTTENCIKCEKCISACPVKIISHDDMNVKSEDIDKCIHCFACVKSCEFNGKDVRLEPFKNIVGMLEANFANVRKEPELFM